MEEPAGSRRLPEGAQLQKLAMGVVLLLALAIALVALLVPRERTTGNNDVVIDKQLTTLTPANGPLCITGVSVPEGTQAVRMYLLTYERDGVRMTMTAKNAAGKILGESSPPPFDDGNEVAFDLPTGDRKDLTLCFRTASAPVVIPGEANGNLTSQVATLGGKTVPGDVALAYVSGEKRSAASLTPTIFERASLFRPAWVGAWTYWLGALAALALIACGWLLLLRAGRLSSWPPRRMILAIAAIAFANAALWALVTPAFNAPDELAHFTYVETLANGQLPDHDVAPGEQGNSYRPSLVYASQVTAVGIIGRPVAKPPHSKAAEVGFFKEFNRLRAGPDEAYGITPAHVYSPAYYLPATAFYAAGSYGNIFDRLLMVRLWSALLLAIGVIFVMLFVREMLPRMPWAPPVAGLAVAFEPMAVHLAGAVSNDNLMLAACAATLWLGARILRRGPTFWTVLAAMMAIVVGYAAKPTALGIAPALAFVLLVAIYRAPERWRALRTCVLAALVPLASVGLIFLLFGSGGSVGTADPSAVALRPATPTGYLSYLWQWYLPSIGSMDEYFIGLPPAYRVFFGDFLADFNSLDTQFSDAFYKIFFAVALALFALVLRAVWVRRDRLRANWPWVLYPLIAVLGTMFLINTTGYLLWRQDGQIFAQGRYLFPAIGVFALYVVVAGIGAGKRWAIPLASAIVIALASINIAGMALSLGRFYI